jgi:hypothetical protein
MYFPYLYGRGVELLALRDIADQLARWGNIIPVVEPVKADPRALGRCLLALQEKHARLYLITNPSHGDFASGGRDVWRQSVQGFIEDAGLVYPAHQISSQPDADALGAFFEEFEGRTVGIVVRTPHILPRDLAALITGRDAIVFVHKSANPRAYLRELPAGQCVEVEGAFQEQARNADYSGSEWFSSSHLEFADDGRPGFSDFGPLPTTFSETGGPPGAVAVHLTYAAADGLWIQHFVSDSTVRGEGDNASKIGEAVAKIAAEVDGNLGKFVQSGGLQAYLSQRVNDLTGNKRQQITHHLATVAASFTPPGVAVGDPTDLG